MDLNSSLLSGMPLSSLTIAMMTAAVGAVKFERALRLSAGQRSSGSSALLHGCGFIGSSILLALLACKILAESDDAGDYHYQHGKDNEQQEYHKYSEEGDLKSENKLFTQGHTHVKIIKH